MNRTVLAIGIIFLFVGVSINPAFAVDIPKKEDVEPKDYLFETIVAIANNLDVQDLLEEYENIINFDYNGKYIFRQLLFRNPELLFSIVFSKPEMTTQYLDKIYNQGIELVNIIGEDKVIEIMESVEVTDKEFLDERSSIIMNDEKLSYRFSALEKMNKELKPEPPFWEYPIICTILLILITPFNLIMIFAEWFNEYLDFFPILNSIMNLIYNVTFKISYPINLVGFILGCWYI